LLTPEPHHGIEAQVAFARDQTTREAALAGLRLLPTRGPSRQIQHGVGAGIPEEIRFT